MIYENADGNEYVAMERTVTDTANTENPAGNENLSTTTSPEISTWDINDVTDGYPRFEVTYDLSSTDDFTETELVAIGVEKGGTDRLTTAATGTYVLEPDYGENTDFALVFDSDGAVVDARRAIETADGS